jgi:hypothetical protein
MHVTLETRVERLERENRKLKRGAVLALVVGAGVILMGQFSGPRVSERLTTRDLVVVDESGRPRIALQSTQGGALVTLSDEAGRNRIIFDSTALAPGGAAVILGDAMLLDATPMLQFLEAGKARIALGVKRNTSALTLSEETGKGIFLAASTEGSVLSVHDAENNIIWKAPQGPITR